MKADPLIFAVAIAILSSAAAPSAVLDNWSLLFWLTIGSFCGVCFTLFRNEQSELTKRAILGKLSICFGPGFCLTGAGIKLSGVEVTAETVLAVSLVLSVAGPVLVPMLAKKAGDKVNGGDS